MVRGNSMPLMDHIREFRNRFLKSILFIGLFSIIGWIYYQEIITELVKPFCDLHLQSESGLPIVLAGLVEGHLIQFLESSP